MSSNLPTISRTFAVDLDPADHKKTIPIRVESMHAIVYGEPDTIVVDEPSDDQTSVNLDRFVEPGAVALARVALRKVRS